MSYEKQYFSQTNDQQFLSLDSFLENYVNKCNFFYQLKFYNSFIASHAMELLDIALNEKDSLISLKCDKSQNAFLLLSNSIKKVMDKLLIDGRFLIKSTIILEYSLVCSSFILAKELVSRVASIFINIILKTKDRNIIIDSVGYLTQMIPFIEDDSVFNLFSLSVSTEDDFKEMQIFYHKLTYMNF